MAVEKVGEKYRCNICGNEVTVTKVGGGTLVCCGEDMEKIGQGAYQTKAYHETEILSIHSEPAGISGHYCRQWTR